MAKKTNKLVTATIRKRAENDFRSMSVRVILPESHEISADYIKKCIEDGIFSASYPAAKLLFDVQNIVQIHRDLNEHCTTGYRRIMAEKLHDPTCTQIEFYIPDPASYEKALMHFFQLAIEDGKFERSAKEAMRRFGQGNSVRILWQESELTGKKKELAEAIGISGSSVMFFVPFPYMYEKLK